jgi:hypothetical protein
MKRPRKYGFLQACLVLILALLSGVALAQDTKSGGKIFKKEQLDQMMASVALYPDALLSQILMAATYPGDVADAATWSKANPKAQGDAAVKQVADKPWDPSVQSLVAFPEVLAQMQAHPDWVQNVGDAFLAQPEDVMDSVQRLRAQAQKAGNLKTNEQQKVIVQQAAPQTTVIQIEPANPEVVYIPSYNPTVVYGAWAYPTYPPTYWPPPPGYYHPVATGIAAGLAFGTGVAIANSLWGGFNWGHNDVNINVNRYNNINVNNRISGNGNVNWNHNPQNRRGTPYRDDRSRQQFGQGVGGAQQREAFRGRDTTRDASRQNAVQSFDKRTGNGAASNVRGQANTAARDNRGTAGNRDAAARNNQGSAARQAPAARNNAFSGAGSPDRARSQVDRGQASQRSMSTPSRGAAVGGRQVSRPVPARGGGMRRR